MTLTRAIARNTIANTIGKLISAILGLWAIALMTRFLGPEGFGGYTTVVGFLQFFGILVDFGLALTTIQLLATNRGAEDKVLGNMLAMRLISAIVFLSLAPLIALLFPYSLTIKQGIAITAVHFLFIAVTQILTAVFQNYLRMGRAAGAEIIGRLFLLGGIFLTIKMNWGLIGMLGATISGGAGQMAALLLLTRTLVPLSLRFDREFWLMAIFRSAPIAISIILNLIYLRADIVILSLFADQKAVGVYGAAYRVIDFVSAFPFMFIGLVMPLLSGAWAAGDKGRFTRFVQRAFDGLILLAIPLLLGGILAAPSLMTMLAGAEFGLSGTVLQILIIALATIFIGTLGGHAVVAIGKQKQMIWGYLACAILSLAGYLIFIPRYSLWGAAWVTVFSQLFIASVTWLVVIKTSRLRLSLKIPARAFLASLPMVAALYWLRESNVLLMIAVGTAVYFAGLLLFKGLTKETIGEIVGLREGG